jgi:hypothetical protein
VIFVLKSAKNNKFPKASKKLVIWKQESVTSNKSMVQTVFIPFDMFSAARPVVILPTNAVTIFKKQLCAEGSL